MPGKGDIFTISLNDNRFVIGQVIQFDERGLSCYSCGLFDILSEDEIEINDINLGFSQCFSVILVTPDCFSSRNKWKIQGNKNPVIPKKFYPYEDLRKKRKPGSRIYDKQTIEEFVNAYYALLPWDNYYKPDFLDELLLTPSKKPKNLIYSK